MKKLLFIIAISTFTACGSGTETDTTPSDSASAAPPDTSNAVNPPLPDTARLMQDTNHITGDTTNPAHDSMLR